MHTFNSPQETPTDKVLILKSCGLQRSLHLFLTSFCFLLLLLLLVLSSVVSIHQDGNTTDRTRVYEQPGVEQLISLLIGE